MNTRTGTLKSRLIEYNADYILISKPENRRYISGFTGSTGYVLISEDRSIFATDFRYIEQANEQCKDFEIKEINREYTIYELMKELKISRLAIEEDFITYQFAKSITSSNRNIELIPLNGLLTKVRMIKDTEEIELIRKAANITDIAFAKILKEIKVGMREQDVANKLEYYMKDLGASGASFDIIVASGKRSSLPHGVASEKIIESGDFVTIDLGCIYKGYCSDMTRTIIIGEGTEKQKEIYNIVLNAQEKALNAIKPGITGSELDKIARDVITDAGYGANFGHSLGHGVGLEVHELPSVVQHETGSVKLESGMIITDEPGIYVSGFGGVRIEDLILVTENGYEVFSNTTKELLEINN